METIKEEKKADLEQLLNSLIKRWRVPFGDKRITNVSWKMQYVWTYNWVFWSNHNVVQMRKSTIEICSKSSLLWQFVCENGMIKEGHKHERILDPTFWEWWADCKRQEHDWNYWYRLIEASLKDESELEDFLLQNIKLWNED